MSRLLDCLGVDVQGPRVDVDEDRHRSKQSERVGRRDEREVGNDHLIAGLEVGEQPGHLERGRARGRNQSPVTAQSTLQRIGTSARELAIPRKLSAGQGIVDICVLIAGELRAVEWDLHGESPAC